MLPKEIFDHRKSKTRDPKRKFAAKEYLTDIGKNTRFTDLKNQKVLGLKLAIDKFGVIDVQLLDFVGSVFLDNKDWIVQPGFNRLFPMNETNKDSIMLEHKLKLSRYFRSFHHREAMIELEQILNYGETLDDKYADFRYTCLKGRILMRWGKLNEAKIEFEKAFTLLEIQFSESERLQLINKRLARMKPVYMEPNWDTDLIDYDEIFLNYLLAQTLDWIDDAEDTPKIISLLEELIYKATKHQSYFDVVNSHHLLTEVAIKSKYNDLAKSHLRSAITLMEEKNLEEFDYVIYGLLNLSLIEILEGEGKIDQIRPIINKMEQKSNSNERFYFRFISYKSKLFLYRFTNRFEDLYNLSNNFIEYVMDQRHDSEDISPLFIIKDIFGFIMQGIKLGHFKQINDVEKYLDFLSTLSEDIPVSRIYKNLIELRFHIKATLHKIIDERAITQIEIQLRNLLEKTQKDYLRYIQVLLLFYEFILDQATSSDDVMEKLSDLANFASENLSNSPYTLMILKNELIRNAVSGDLSGYKHKLISINKNHQIKEIDNLINLLDEFEENKIEFKEFIRYLISDEILYSTFEKPLDLPIEIIIEKK
ncbi:MAG: hypothetical protein GPJ54_11825 [Candidatus Heimdallarchaeota archaeon]|nr:hypothetical protein [Candidatus Heimdallarchaeota archaeon]